MTQDAMAYVLVTAALVLMVLGYAFKRPALALGAALAWVVLGLVAYNTSAGPWDVAYGLFWLSIAMVIVAAFEVFYSKEKKLPPEEDTKDDWDNYAEDMEARRGRMDKMRGLSRRKRRDD